MATTTQTSITNEADYGCPNGNAYISVTSSITPTTFTPSTVTPGQADITFNTEIHAYYTNFKESDGQYSVSTATALAMSSPVTPYVEGDWLQAWPRDCQSNDYMSASDIVVGIKAGDTVRAGVRSKDDTGLTYLPEWFDVELDDNYTITPPQNLQVTFPSVVTGKVSGSVSAWSKNPNITGHIFVPTDETDVLYNDWVWKVEYIDSDDNIVFVYKSTAVNKNLNYTPNGVDFKTNESYRMRVTVSNNLQQTASLSYPAVHNPPLAPTIRNITRTANEDGTYNFVVDWAKPKDGGTYNESVVLWAVGYAPGVTLATVEDGNSASGTYTIENVQPGVNLEIRLLVNSITGQSSVSQNVYTPLPDPTISYKWSDNNNTLTIMPTLAGIINFNIKVGDYPRGNNLAQVNDAPMLTTSNLPRGEGAFVYVTVSPVSNIPVVPEVYNTVSVPNPTLGVVNDCSGTVKTVVDIVEVKDGEHTPRWVPGTRVVTNSGCRYTVTFVVEDGSPTPPPQTVERGQTATPPQNPTSDDGAAFAYWAVYEEGE